MSIHAHTCTCTHMYMYMYIYMLINVHACPYMRIYVSVGGDPGDSLAFRRPHRISLLELISSPVWDNSAESTAQRLLQHMATRLIGSESTENLNMSQMVRKVHVLSIVFIYTPVQEYIVLCIDVYKCCFKSTQRSF